MRTPIATAAFAATALLLATPAQDGAGAAPDPFEPLRFLEGVWEGPGQGPGGANRLERHYEPVLDGRYLHCRNTGTFENEVHENWDFFSYDKLRGTLVLRQFHNEGFVNQYTCAVVEAADGQPMKLVFESEHIENLEDGWRARLTFVVHGPDHYDETFELSQSPDSGWFQLTNGTLRRVD